MTLFNIVAIVFAASGFLFMSAGFLAFLIGSGGVVSTRPGASPDTSKNSPAGVLSRQVWRTTKRPLLAVFIVSFVAMIAVAMANRN